MRDIFLVEQTCCETPLPLANIKKKGNPVRNPIRSIPSSFSLEQHAGLALGGILPKGRAVGPWCAFLSNKQIHNVICSLSMFQMLTFGPFMSPER